MKKAIKPLRSKKQERTHLLIMDWYHRTSARACELAACGEDGAAEAVQRAADAMLMSRLDDTRRRLAAGEKDADR